MLDVISEMMSDDLNLDECNPEMIVITTNNKYNGAIAMTDIEFIKGISQKYFNNNDMYILPSSIHECICIPKVSRDIRDVKQMVHEVNTTQLSKEDFLSDEVFEYNAILETVNVA